MELKTLQQLQEEFDLLNKSDKLAFIRFYENNIESIENIDSAIDDEHHNFKLRLLCEYGLSLVAAGQYTKGASILAKSIPMFESLIVDPKNSSYLEHLLWNYGLALWELKRINDSTNVFQKLVNNFPENDKYRTWLAGLKASKIRRIANPLLFVCAIWLLGDLFLFNKLDSQTKLYLSILGVVLFLTVVLLEVLIQIVKKKKSTKA